MVCVIDEDGNPVSHGTVASHPQAIDSFIRQQALEVRRVGMETGPLAVWFHHELRERGVPLDCIHTSHVHAALATQLNKTDSNDERGIAQLTRSGWYRSVEVKNIASHEVRLLLGARSQLGQYAYRPVQPHSQCSRPSALYSLLVHGKASIMDALASR